jgi:succinate dehydrogenase/fumarate reductase flavoprotein subunit
MTRKNMGGVAVDRQMRVLDERDRVLPGLYAVGELNGSLGINGRHGLDGMFLGPAILSGRLAGQAIAANYPAARPVVVMEPISAPPDAGNWQPGLTAKRLESMLAESRDGYWHFQVSHQLVVERRYACTRCHSAQLRFSRPGDRASMLAQTKVCTNCH